jgi:hypothetical protein
VTKELLLAYEEVDNLLDSAQFSQAIGKMRPWNKVELNQFYQAYPHRYPILKHEAFNKFWAEKRLTLHSHNSFAAQKHIPDCDLVLGYVFYLLALTLKNKSNSPDQSDEYLKLALKFDSIHAAQTYLHKIIMQHGDQEKRINAITETLLSWKTLAAKHGAPGFLLLANGYLHLANISKLNNKRYEEACFELWKNITLVELEEPQSVASINNAYFGQGFKLGNAQELTTVKDIKTSFRKIVTSSIQQEATKEAQALFIDDESKLKLSAWRKGRGALSLNLDTRELDESDLLAKSPR